MPAQLDQLRRGTQNLAWIVCRALVVSMFATFAMAGRSAELNGNEGGDAAFFRDRIEAVLAEHCYGCHSAKAAELEGGLRLDQPALLRKGGDSGPVVVAGDSERSLLIKALRHEGGLAMPPEGQKLPPAVVADFVRWIDGGAIDPRPANPGVDAASPSDPAASHWAFQILRKPGVPAASDGWVRNPIDAFVLEKLAQRNWRPAPRAEKSEWLRRVYFDLIGLPPSPTEVDAFLDDDSPQADERVVDRLLSSPQFGEHWAQHWLDVVRYAETEGYEYDRHLPDAWRFRDYVIRSFNEDKPFDQFLIEQLAGDELDPANQEYQVASIFHRLGPVRRNAGNPEIALSRNEVLMERTDIIGVAFLGLTIGCARCHNHKLEPISQKDYYRFQSYLAATDEHDIVLATTVEQQAWEARTQKITEQVQRLRKQAKSVDEPEKTRLQEQASELEEQLPPPLATIPATWNNTDERTAIHVLRRGVWENKGEPVGPRPPGVLVPEEYPELSPDVAKPRTQLARWIASPDHPLTARVIVNRLWQSHFGTGLVKTANDFGTHGDPPSHPELLDWLAATLIENGWQLKPIHRLLVLSNTYRQASWVPDAVEQERDDPENRWWWRFNRRRLSAEELRDAMLAVSGRLNEKAGGESIMVPVDPEIVKLLYKPSQWQVATDEREHDRRSIYLLAKRNLRLPFIEAFDAPALLTSCGRRQTSTHAPQALELLNGDLANDLAVSFAQRLREETSGHPGEMVERAYRLALGREPTSGERELAIRFVCEQPLSEFALAVFNLNGFLYVP